MLELYIWGCFLVCAMVFTLNTGVLCLDADANAQVDSTCESSRDIELIGAWTLGAIWILSNLAILVIVLDFCQRALYSDRLRFRYSSSPNEPRAMKFFSPAGSRHAAAVEQAAEAREHKMKEHRFFNDDHQTLRKRRARALQAFSQIEHDQLELVRKLKRLQNQGNAPRQEIAALQRQRLRNVPQLHPLLRECGAAKRRHQLPAFRMDERSGLYRIFARAEMTREAVILGPLLQDSHLDAQHLTQLYNDGVGSGAVNSLVEQAGITKADDRLKIIAALGEKQVGSGQSSRAVVWRSPFAAL